MAPHLQAWRLGALAEPDASRALPRIVAGKKTPLSKGVTRRAAELLFVRTGPTLYRDFPLEAGWTPREWMRWVSDILIRSCSRTDDQACRADDQACRADDQTRWAGQDAPGPRTRPMIA